MDQMQQPRETTVGVIPGLRQKKGFLGLHVDLYSLVLTSSRLVFAVLTSQMQKDAVEQARQTAKQQGQGALGQWGAQFHWMQVVVDHYAALPVDAILAEQQGNFAIPNSQVKKARIKVDVGDEDSSSSTHLEIEAAASKYKFELTVGNSSEVKQLLQKTLGAAVK